MVRNEIVDQTPDGKYALRILRYYRKRCDEKWAVTGADEDTERLYEMMNKHQDQRAYELDEAIRILEAAVI